jgi:hypothetical protein
MVNPAADPGGDAVTRPGLRAGLGLVWIAGLLVAVGAGVATAHGLYEVALAAGVPRMLAWLYPIITDGLALVAYATTTRLNHHGRRYAWTVVVAAAGLSGLTQASYLAGGVKSAPAVLRFAIGAWPALAAAIVAHLLYLLSASHSTTPVPESASNPVDHSQLDTSSPSPAAPTRSVPTSIAPSPVTNRVVRLGHPAVSNHSAARRSPLSPHQALDTPTGHTLDTQLDTRGSAGRPIEHLNSPPAAPPLGRPESSPAGDRATAVAREHAARHGRLPTVRELASLARVARGTAATALKQLRQPPTR